MNISLKTNRLITIITGFYMVLLAASLFIKLTGVLVSPMEYYLLNFFMAAIYLFLLIYLIRILAALNEAPAITSAFTMYTGIQALLIIIAALPAKLLGDTYTAAIGLLNMVLIFYLFLQAFNIKCLYISLPYKLFGFSLIFVMASKLILTLVFAPHATLRFVSYLDILSMLTPLSILFILKRTGEYISDTEQNSPGVLEN